MLLSFITQPQLNELAEKITEKLAEQNVPCEAFDKRVVRTELKRFTREQLLIAVHLILKEAIAEPKYCICKSYK